MISSSNTAFKKTNQSGSIFTELNITDDCTTVAISATLQNPSTTQLQPTDKNDTTSVLVSNISQPYLRSHSLCSPFLLTSTTALPPLLSFSNSAITTPLLVSKKSNKRNTVRTKKPKTASVIERRTRANFAKRQREKCSSKQKRPINAALSRQRRLCKHYMAIEFALEYQLNRLLSYSLIAELCAVKARPLNFDQIFENWKKNRFYLRYMLKINFKILMMNIIKNNRFFYRFDKPSMNFKSIDRRFTRKHLELYRDFESVNRHSWGSHFPFDTVTTPLEKYAWSVTRVVDRKIELISGINIVVYLLEWTPHNGRTFTEYVFYVYMFLRMY